MRLRMLVEAELLSTGIKSVCNPIGMWIPSPSNVGTRSPAEASRSRKNNTEDEDGKGLRGHFDSDTGERNDLGIGENEDVSVEHRAAVANHQILFLDLHRYMVMIGMFDSPLDNLC